MLVDGVNVVGPSENVMLGALALCEKVGSEEKPLPAGENGVAAGENGVAAGENGGAVGENGCALGENGVIEEVTA